MSQARLALVVSVALLAAIVIVTLTRSPLQAVGQEANGEVLLGTTAHGAVVCQADETLPAGVSAIRVGLAASFGPDVSLKAYAGSRMLTSGRRGADWTGTSVTVPVKPLEHPVPHVKLCIRAPSTHELLQLWGSRASKAEAAAGGNGERLPGRMNVTYMARGSSSWWSRASVVATHLGFGRSISGTWIALLVAVLIAVTATVVVGLGWRELP